MTSRHTELADLLADAVAEPPPTAVTASATYRRGRRRRGLLHAGAAGVVAAAVAVAALGVSELRPEPEAVPPVAPKIFLDPLPETPTRCADLAAAVRTVAEATLPAEISWTGPRLWDPSTTDCTGGGLFYVDFVYRGASHTLGFEGGESAAGEPCDPDRRVTDCEDDGRYRVGHYRSADDYGVLLGGTGLFFFLGLEDGTDPPLTTDELATVAKEIARVVYAD
jgi:hypothetical protein